LRKSGENLLAEIVGAHVNVNFAVRRAVQISGADDFALLDEDDGVASNFDFAEEMGIEEDGGAAFSLVTDDVANKASAHGVEAGGRLVEEDEFRAVNQGLRETDPLQHAFRKATESPVAMSRESDEVQEGGNAVAELRGCEPAEAAMKRKEFGGGQPVVEAEVFGEEADLAADLDAREGLIEDLSMAARRFDKAE